MQTPDWNVFSQHVNKLAQTQVNHLKELTRNHLQAGNNEKKARYIKVAYIDDYDGPPLHNAQGTRTPPPRVVLWEEHTIVDGLDANQNNHATNVDALKKSLRTQYLPDDLRNLKTELYFASMQLRGQKRHSEPEMLRRYLLSYCDKIYAKPLPQQSNAIWMQYKDYFNQAQMMILANPTLYTELCLNLKELFSHPSSSMVVSEDKLYSYLVLLRSLPDTVARAQDGCIEAAKSLKELLALLDILDDDESALAHEATYNVINAIEWLTYLLPQMYGTMLTSPTSPPLYEELVECLEKYISGEKYKLAIRMEAAWALGWASISSIGVANCVHQYDKSARWRVDRLRSNVLRHVVGTAYLRASFTLVSFGPARISSNSVEPLPGGYLSNQAPGQINFSLFDSARHAASHIVYGEMEQIVNGNIRFQLLLATLTGCWLMINDLIAILFSLSIVTTIWLAAVPTLILLVLIVQLTWGWGRGYWWRIVVIWSAFVLLIASPWIDIINWQQTLIVVGAFITFLTIIVGLLSSWISVLAMFPTLMRFFRFKRKP